MMNGPGMTPGSLVDQAVQLEASGRAISGGHIVSLTAGVNER